MNLLKPFIADTFWSFRKEFSYLVLTFFIILLIPIFVVITLTHVGIDRVSDALVKYDAAANAVKLFYPNGTLFKEITISSTWPVHGVVTLEFGEIDLPYQPFHTGIDIANPRGKIGDPITPFMNGKVTYIGNLSWGYGKYIIVDNGDNISSLYAHLSAVNVTKGQEVHPGDVIGFEGSTGWSTGAHLHFETRVFGIPVNPRTFIEGDPY